MQDKDARTYIAIAMVLIVCASLYASDWFFFVSLLAFSGISYLQNVFYTWSSRSRNSNDPEYHRYASWSSNFIYQAQRVAGVGVVITPIIDWQTGAMSTLDMSVRVGLTIIIYTLLTTEGSVFAMRVLIRTERGSRKVVTENQLEDKLRALDGENKQ